MPDLLAGSKVRAADTPPAVYAQDISTIADITSTTYISGTPEVGVTFIAPTTGRVKLTVGGSLRNNAANSDRVTLTPQVFVTNTSGVEFLAPTVFRGICTDGTQNADYCTYGRTTLLEGLTPGQQYYARVMHAKFGSGGATCDVAMRDILVDPAT